MIPNLAASGFKIAEHGSANGARTGVSHAPREGNFKAATLERYGA
jgi:hypothetical protein